MKGPLAAALLLLASTASAGKLLKTRSDDKDRKTLEKVEQLSQTGAKAELSESGSHRAGKGFSGVRAGPALGRAAVPVAESEYVPTAAGGSITSGGPVRGTPYVVNCPKNDSVLCKNVTPYQRPMNSILKDIKGALRELKTKVLLSTLPFLAGLAGLSALIYITLVGLARKIRNFARKTDQKAQGRLLSATGAELFDVAQDVKKKLGTGVPISMTEIDRRVKKAGEKERERIKKQLSPKE